MKKHRLTSVQLTHFYLQRIKKLNPTLNAVITVSPTALADAWAADKARRRGDKRPLLGIPIVVKDNVDTTDMPTTAGSRALAGCPPRRVHRPAAAGRGRDRPRKTNLSEWANFRSGPSSTGWSGIGGKTNMPYVLERNPCGSSSGSAVVAARLSRRRWRRHRDERLDRLPVRGNCVVGLKPTVGLLSRAASSRSRPPGHGRPDGPQRDRRSSLLGAATGVDPDDPATAAQAGNAKRDYTKFLDKRALKHARIGVWRAGTFGPSTAAIVEPILADTIATRSRTKARP